MKSTIAILTILFASQAHAYSCTEVMKSLGLTPSFESLGLVERSMSPTLRLQNAFAFL